ncbi:MAG: hypothetical protein HY279_13900 [Nitrospinae bacterium]|nr:hypothetical protein [Nitrospinota bacterium]
MNGDKFLLDTNILLYISGGKVSIDNLPEGQFYISFITELEALSYPSITPDEEKHIREVFSQVKEIKIKSININTA